MNPSDRLTLLGYLLLVMPTLFFLPGYVLTRTFLRIPSSASFTEMIFLRVFLSVLVSSSLGLGLAGFSYFDGQDLVFAVIGFSFLLLAFRRFRLWKGGWNFRLGWEDFFATLVLIAGVVVFFWPSEEIGSAFSLGAHLARTGTFREAEDFSIPLLLKIGPLSSVWFAIVDAFFGVRLSLLTIPVLSLFSLWALFFWAGRMSGLIGAIAAASLLSTHFTPLWFYRLPEGYPIAQLLILGAFYLTHLYFEEGRWGFLVTTVLALVLSWMAAPQVLVFIGVFGVSLFIGVFLRGKQEALPAPFKRFLLGLPLAWFFLAFKAPEQVLWAIPSWLWITAALGVAFFLYKGAKIRDLGLVIPLLLYPLFTIWQVREGPYMINLAGLVPVILPSVMLFAGYLMSFLSRAGRIARGVVIVALVVIAGTPLYLNRHLIWTRDYQGLLKFYETLSKSFLPNDLVFSDEENLASLLRRLYGLKVYPLGSEPIDLDFQREIRRWLKDGGRAYVISRRDKTKMEGFELKLESVERLRTKALEKSSAPPERRVLQEILVRVYQAVPKTEDR